MLWRAVRPLALKRWIPTYEAAAARYLSTDVGATLGASNPFVSDIAYHVHQHGGKLPLGRVLRQVTSQTKLAIFKSGKGLEGYVRSHGDLKIETLGSEKVIMIASAELAERVKTMTPPSDARPMVVEVKPTPEKPTTDAKPKSDAPVPAPVLPMQPKPVVAEKPTVAVSTATPQAPPKLPAATVVFKTPPSSEPSSQPSSEPSSSSGSTAVAPAQQEPPTRTPAASDSSAVPQPSPAASAAAQPTDSSPSAPSPSHATAAAAELKSTPSPVATTQTTGGASPSESSQEDANDPNLLLRKRLNDILVDATKYYNLNEVFTLVYRGTTEVKYSNMLAYIQASGKYFWYQKSHVARRLPGQMEPPPFVVAPLTKQKAAAGGKPASSPVAAGSAAVGDPFGGWGSAQNIPTADDIYEVLKYVPIHWVEIGHLTMPKEVRKKHVRLSSIVVWFEKQPRYFELRLVGGCIEVRRSIVLHPEAHNLTKEQAEEMLAKKLAENAKKGTIVQQMQEFTANREKIKAESLASATSGLSKTAMPSSMSPAMDAVVKLVVRVCPGYPIPIQQILRRSSKKTITAEDIVQCLPAVSNQIDRIDVTTVNGEKTIFLRKKTGVDSSTWGEQFVADVSQAQNLSVLCSLMTLSCAQWDRTHFLYVRLTDDEKRAVNGFDGMVEVLKRHPFVFKTGEYFFKRHNPSDPSSEADQEPTTNTQSSTVVLEENPYHNPTDLALVFHYLTPDDQPCTLSHFVESSSPAMRSVLPPRLVTVIQGHPELFICREITPGQYSVAKAIAKAAEADTGATLSREEVIRQVIKAVPVRGIDIGHLNNALTPALRAAVSRCFGASGLNGLVASSPQCFHVVHSPPYTTIFLKS